MTVAHQLICQEIVEVVTDYLEGAIDPDLRASFEAHLADCPHCTAYLEQLRAMIRVAGTIEASTISAGLDPVDGVFNNADDKVSGGETSVIRSVVARTSRYAAQSRSNEECNDHHRGTEGKEKTNAAGPVSGVEILK